MRCAAANEKSRRDNQGQRHAENEFGSNPCRALNFDFAVQLIEIRTDHVKAYTASGKFCFGGSCGEAWMEKHFAQLAFRQLIGGFLSNDTAINCALFDAFVVNSPAIIFDFDVDVIAAMIGAQCDSADFRFAGERAPIGEFDSVRNGVADEMYERIGNLLNDVVVKLGFAAEKIEFDKLAGRLCGVANGAGKTRVESADWHHARSGNFVLQVVRELCKFVDIAFNSANETAKLREHFVDVSGDFGHGARQDIDVVVAVHFQFAEIGPEGGVPGGGAGEHLRSGRGCRSQGTAIRADAVKFVLFLKFVDFALEALFRKAKRIAKTFELGNAADHTGSIDDQLSDRVHHAIETS